MKDTIFGGLIGLVFVLVGVSVFAHMLRLAIHRFRRRAQIKDTPTSRIGMLKPGLREVRGRVLVPDEPVLSPMSNARCVYYRFVVKERRRQGKNSKMVTVIDDARAARCVIEDSSGRVEVPIASAELHLESDHSARSGFLSDPSPELKQMLSDRYGRSTEIFMFNKTMTYHETVVVPGDELHVLGHVARGGERWTFEAKENAPVLERLLVSDHEESALVSKLLWAGVGHIVFGLVFLVAFSLPGAFFIVSAFTRR